MQEKLENTFADRYERLKIVSWNRLSIKSKMQFGKKKILAKAICFKNSDRNSGIHNRLLDLLAVVFNFSKHLPT